MRRFPSVCHLPKSHWTILHNSVSIVAGVTKFGMEMHLGVMWFDLEVQGQGHRSKNDHLEQGACL